MTCHFAKQNFNVKYRYTICKVCTYYYYHRTNVFFFLSNVKGNLSTLARVDTRRVIIMFEQNQTIGKIVNEHFSVYQRRTLT